MMGDFFSGWRRKVGIITLLTALVFMAGWVRSLTTFDMFNWHRDNKSIYVVRSNRGCLSWECLEKTHALQITLSSFYLTGDAASYDFLERAHQVNWHWKWRGFEVGEITLIITGWRNAFGVIPYWSVVIPLTLFSAYFLLSKPHISEQKKAAELTLETAA